MTLTHNTFVNLTGQEREISDCQICNSNGQSTSEQLNIIKADSVHHMHISIQTQKYGAVTYWQGQLRLIHISV